VFADSLAQNEKIACMQCERIDLSEREEVISEFNDTQ